MGRVFWISGIDTGIGKTMVTGLMAKGLLAAGHDVITVKMVQTGNDGYSEDIEEHRAICADSSTRCRSRSIRSIRKYISAYVIPSSDPRVTRRCSITRKRASA